MQEDEREFRIEEALQPVLRDHGLTLVDLEWRGHRPRGVLKVFVDKPGGVRVEDCQRASRELGDVLDAAGLVQEAYDLEVSSPGLDRQLRKDRELRWAVGKRVRCWLAGGEEHHGRLVDVADGVLTLDRDGARVELPRGRVTKARLDVEVPWPRRPSGL
jgi:ribosome maturation factor RimP